MIAVTTAPLFDAPSRRLLPPALRTKRVDEGRDVCHCYLGDYQRRGDTALRRHEPPAPRLATGRR